MKRDLTKVKDKVLESLEEYPAARDDDKLLFLHIMYRHYGLRTALGSDGYRRFKDWFMNSDIPSPESIRRCRQKWQEEGYYIGTKRKKRMAEVPETIDFIRGFLG